MPLPSKTRTLPRQWLMCYRRLANQSPRQTRHDKQTHKTPDLWYQSFSVPSTALQGPCWSYQRSYSWFSNPCKLYKLLPSNTAPASAAACHHTGGLRDTFPAVSLCSSLGMGIHTLINCFEKYGGYGDLEPIKIKTLFPKGLILRDW